MSCTNFGGVIVCQPTRGGAIQRQQRKCLGICETDTSRVVMLERNPYYGPDWYCVDCGDTWCIEGLFRRPFRRAWRKKAIARAQQLWDEGCSCDVEYDAEMYALPCKKHADRAVVAGVL